jgi:hypothetical protein
MKSTEIMDKGMIKVPVYLFRDRSVAVLEALVEYLKDVQGLSYHEIAVLLNRNDRTIWTVYNRAKKKRQYRK